MNLTEPEELSSGFHRTISGKLAALVVGVILITASLLISILFFFIRDSIRDEIHAELEMQTASLQQLVADYIAHQEERMKFLLAHQQILDLIRLYNEDESADRAFQAEQVNTLFASILAVAPDYRRIHLLHRNGRLIASTDPLLRETTRPDPIDYGEDPRSFQIRLNDVHNQVREGVAFAPIHDASGEQLGSVLIEFEVSSLLATIASMKPRHHSNLMRIAERDGSDIHYLFLEEAELGDLSGSATDSDEPMELALQGESGIMSDYMAATGELVVAAYRPIGTQGWALVSQFRHEEAYAVIGEALLTLVIAGILFALVAGFLAIVICHSMLNPIHKLAEATIRIAQGDFRVRVQTKGQDEVGSLATAFNKMVQEIQQHTKQLESRVVERTADLMRSRDSLASLVKSLEEQADLMRRDLRRAETIQKSLLPREVPELEDFSIAGAYIPGRNVGGDLFNVIQVDEDHVAMYVADAAGHGAAAALLSVLFKLRLESPGSSTAFLDPCKLLASLNESLVNDVSAPGVFVTAAIAVLDIRTRDVVMVSAGHPPIVIAHQNGDVEIVQSTGPALGLRTGATYREVHTSLLRDDCLLMYTDGIFDVEDDDAPTIDELAEIILQPGSNDAKVRAVLERSRAAPSQTDKDDISVVLVQVRDELNYLPQSFQLKGRPGEQVPLANGVAGGQLGYFESEDYTTLYLVGRVTWQFGQALFDAATSIEDEHRTLVLELGECVYLDSAMLGTLHEVVERGIERHVIVAVQNVPESIEKSFYELGLTSVVDAMQHADRPTPSFELATPVDVAMRYDHDVRILHAHEELAKLNKHNEDEFNLLISQLRDEQQTAHAQ